MKFSTLVATLLAPLAVLASPIERAAAAGLPRLAIYFQTTHDSAGNPISMLPLVNEQRIALTHLLVCSLHVQNDHTVHLNDLLWNDPKFDTMWAEAQILKNNGVKIMAMVGGAAPGSWATDTLGGSDAAFGVAYATLKEVVVAKGLQGLDLDVEQTMSLSAIERLINRLYADFGSGFIITLTPVGSALYGSGNLSGFSYKQVETDVGSKVSFYNTQYYSGFGSASSTYSFDQAVANGFAANKIVIGQLTSSDNGYGYISPSTLNSTVIALKQKYGTIGGVMGWEYFNSAPGGTSAPWQWAIEMTKILRPNAPTTLTVTARDAKNLKRAWHASTNGDAHAAKRVPGYDQWINA
jgi:hypothetical protein